MFDSPDKLVLGLVTGIFFGFLLHKGRLTKCEVIVGQLLLRDWTALKVLATATVVSAIGVYFLVGINEATLTIKPLRWGGVIFGGALFGLGLAILGYCPGTTVAASGEGKRDAVVGLLGMLTGATFFVAGYHNFSFMIKAFGERGAITLPEATQSSPWWWIFGLSVLTAIGLLTATIAERRRSAKKVIEALRLAREKAIASPVEGAEGGVQVPTDRDWSTPSYYKDTTMTTRVMISDYVTAAGQPTEQELRDISAAGFKSVVNLRSAGEPDLPISPEEEQHIVETLGMRYLHFPVTMESMCSDVVDRFRDELAHLPTPIFVHCHKATRAGTLALIYQGIESNASGEEILEEGKSVGLRCDIPALRQFVIDYVDSHRSHPERHDDSTQGSKSL